MIRKRIGGIMWRRIMSSDSDMIARCMWCERLQCGPCIRVVGISHPARRRLTTTGQRKEGASSHGDKPFQSESRGNADHAHAFVRRAPWAPLEEWLRGEGARVRRMVWAKTKATSSSDDGPATAAASTAAEQEQGSSVEEEAKVGANPTVEEGLFASARIPITTVLASLPGNVHFGQLVPYDNVHARLPFPGSPRLRLESMENLDDTTKTQLYWASMALLLQYEAQRTLCEPRADNAVWLDSLPDSEMLQSNGHVLFASRQHLDAMHGTALVRECRRVRSGYLRLERVRSHLRQSMPDVFIPQLFHEHGFRWAVATILSRSWADVHNDRVPAIVPLADLPRPAPRPCDATVRIAMVSGISQTERDDSSDGAVLVSASRDLRPGDELFADYGISFAQMMATCGTFPIVWANRRELRPVLDLDYYAGVTVALPNANDLPGCAHHDAASNSFGQQHVAERNLHRVHMPVEVEHDGADQVQPLSLSSLGVFGGISVHDNTGAQSLLSALDDCLSKYVSRDTVDEAFFAGEEARRLAVTDPFLYRILMLRALELQLLHEKRRDVAAYVQEERHDTAIF